MTISARTAVIHGRVQGVAFRHHTKLAARAAGLCGWVRNCADGTVEVWFEGDDEAVARLETWLKRGPPAATVERVELETVTPAGHTQFKVRFD
ncbi:MAG: acylphosphatase [Planctomycetes bacterium]|nr:acylphosphatase [Planctomycetota bacterium]